MKNRIVFIILILVAAVSVMSYTLTSEIKALPVMEFRGQISGKDVQLIDIRNPEEYSSGHIENAANIDFKNKFFLESCAALDKAKPVYMYCKTGGRSADAAPILEEAGFDVFYLKGGIMAWKEAGLKIISSDIEKASVSVKRYE